MWFRKITKSSPVVYYSAKQRLSAWLAALFCISILLASLFVYQNAHEESNELFDYQLKLLAIAFYNGIDTNKIYDDKIEEDDNSYGIVAWRPDGKKIFSYGIDEHIASSPPLGYGTFYVDSDAWRSYVFSGRKGTVLALQPMAKRDKTARVTAFYTVTPLLILMPFFMLFQWLLVRREFRHVDYIGELVAQRGERSLEPLRLQTISTELRPLVASLERMFEKLQQTLRKNREFIELAAHELRTPIAGLKLQYELVLSAPDMHMKAKRFLELQEGIERCERLISQLLTLGKYEHMALKKRQTEISGVLKNVLIDLESLAQMKDVELVVDRIEPITKECDSCALTTIFKNIIENAIRYSNNGQSIHIRLFKDKTRTVFSVADTGHGISDDVKHKVFDRFFTTGAGTNIGTGLGLAIVKTICDANNSVIELRDNQPSGAIFTITFPD